MARIAPNSNNKTACHISDDESISQTFPHISNIPVMNNRLDTLIFIYFVDLCPGLLPLLLALARPLNLASGIRQL